MDEAKRDFVRSWFTKAQHDLASSRKLATNPDPYLDTAIYHCQQAAEKAVKGFLVFHDQRVKKTHDIEALISLAIPFEAQFSSWKDVGQNLTPYSAEFRYPGEEGKPDKDEFDRALQEAEDLYTFVLSKLPLEVHP